MASLIGSSRTIDNATMRARITSAIRQTAPGKAPVEGVVGELAAQALIDPGSLVAHFVARAAVNPNVSAAACEDCGYAPVPDSDITFIVDSEWDAVAAAVFPSPDGP